jgi:long-chain acyl-CoA synthetase
MNIANWLRDAAHRWPNRPALFRGEVALADYVEFAMRARARAVLLKQAYAVEEGDRVALFMKNCCEYLELLYAIWWAGAVAVPINCKLHPSEAKWIADNAQAKLMFTDDGKHFKSEGLPTCCSEVSAQANLVCIESTAAGLSEPVSRVTDDLAWLFYTSGTTGRSKGVMLSHGNLMAMSLCYPVDVDQVTGTDAVVYAAPMSHGAGLYNFIHVRCGARHVVPESRGFKSGELFDLARSLRQVSLFAAPTMVKRMVEEARSQGYSGDGLKSVIYGGAPMYVADLRDALAVFGSRLIQIYGQGESPMTVSALSRDVIADSDSPQWERLIASVGMAQSCVEIKIVDELHHMVPSGHTGEIAVRGATVMQGYWRNDTATRQTLIDGWLYTGDIGYLDSDGYLTLTDRSKDVIISGGSNVYPREVEEVLARHPGVFEVCVVGEPDAEWGESVVAFVVARKGHVTDQSTLNSWFMSQMASFKKPKKYVFCPELPKNSYGKVLKTQLRQWLKERSAESV